MDRNTKKVGLFFAVASTSDRPTFSVLYPPKGKIRKANIVYRQLGEKKAEAAKRAKNTVRKFEGMWSVRPTQKKRFRYFTQYSKALRPDVTAFRSQSRSDTRGKFPVLRSPMSVREGDARPPPDGQVLARGQGSGLDTAAFLLAMRLRRNDFEQRCTKIWKSFKKLNAPSYFLI